MDSRGKELLVSRFVRSVCNNNTMELLPEDIIRLLVLWLCFGDIFDEKLSHKDIKIENIQDEQYGICQKVQLKESLDDMNHRTAICKSITANTAQQR